MKTKLIFLLLVSSLLMIEDSKAQLAEGSTAPDFTAEDIQGNTHRLYADYLNNGMPVIIDISATWCGPCWNYHESHALKDLYNLYGANGSNEVGVLFVEGDANTDLDDLNGTGDNTYGDWVTGTPYPIIDDAALNDLFEIDYYPTIYGICPDGSTYEFGQKTTSQIISLFESKCGFTANGTNDNASVTGNLQKVCLSGESVSPSVEIQNYGSNNLTSLTLELFEEGNATAIESKDWSGDLATLAKETVEFSPINNITGNQNYSAKIVTANGNTDNFSYGNEGELSVELAPMETENTIKIKIVTDNYPGETSGNLKDDNGNILESFGPYQEGPGQDGAGGPDAFQTFEYSVSLPLGVKCYELNIFDEFGDGMGLSNNSEAGYAIIGNNIALGTDIISVLNKPKFGSSVKELFAIDSDGEGVSISEQFTIGLKIYPNPTRGRSTLVIDATMQDDRVELSIFDILGEKVMEETISLNTGTNTIPLALEHLQTGVYTVELLSSSTNVSQKLIKIN